MNLAPAAELLFDRGGEVFGLEIFRSEIEPGHVPPEVFHEVRDFVLFSAGTGSRA